MDIIVNNQTILLKGNATFESLHDLAFPQLVAGRYDVDWSQIQEIDSLLFGWLIEWKKQCLQNGIVLHFKGENARIQTLTHLYNLTPLFENHEQ